MTRASKGVSALGAYLALYVALYGGFGTASPFLPSFLSERGLTPSQIGVLLAAGTAIRLLSAPLAAQIADRLGRPRLILLIFLALSAAVALLYLPAVGFAALVGVSLMHATSLAPVTPAADALALGQRKRFDYGWVRGAGSAAFVVGTFVSGFVTDRHGLTAMLPLNAACLAAAAVCAAFLPVAKPETAGVPANREKAGDIRVLLRDRAFMLTVAMAALILASHAMHDAFAVIRWRAAGYSGQLISVLWSEAVIAEVVVFTLAGPWLLRRFSPPTCAALAAVAGVLRWVVVSLTLSPVAVALVEPLHGLTFALLHLAAMRILAVTVPANLATTAQAFYGTVAAGAASALATLASGPLYEAFGGLAFLAMAALCALALIPAFLLSKTGVPVAESEAIRNKQASSDGRV